MNYAPLAPIIGDPSDLLVAEMVWAHCNSEATWAMPLAELTEEIINSDLFTECNQGNAAGLIANALHQRDILLATWDESIGTPTYGQYVVTLDDIARMRLTRRCLFWRDLEPEGIRVPTHMPNEGFVARAAVVQWTDDYEEAVGASDLLDLVGQLTGLDEFWQVHIVLNALDSGAICSFPETSNSPSPFNCRQHRFYLTSGWTQPDHH
ncbi:MAG: hypothetical protein QM733_15735 [Ilumatobacteraceae bacterium]